MKNRIREKIEHIAKGNTSFFGISCLDLGLTIDEFQAVAAEIQSEGGGNGYVFRDRNVDSNGKVGAVTLKRVKRFDE